MPYSVLIILAVGLIVPALTFFAMALVPGKIVWILFSIGVALFGILFLTERHLSRALEAKSTLGAGRWRQGAIERRHAEQTQAGTPQIAIIEGPSTAGGQASSDPLSE